MEAVDLTRFFLAFVFVIGLIGILGMALKRYGNPQRILGAKQEGPQRIEVLEVRYIDPRRRLLLVRRDEMEHLLLLADGRETVIESGIKRDE